ncbi:MAG TPA: glycosyltransferase family 4 protein [Burkholderiales bacterium]|nr:glycosyltransferase family 4 protein [Burkholderiales bacterium]
MDQVVVKRILMIAYHFPPVKGSSGIQRTLRFAQYLSEHGWSPIVLAPHPRAYSVTSNEEMGDGLNGIHVCRAFALDTAKHLSIAGRYSRLAALPDRWSSWLLGATPVGLNLIRKFRPDVIWSTYPVATAHLIGLTLHKLSGIPWVADFRDPMAQDGYPSDPLTWKTFSWLEKKVVRHANAVTFTTPGAMREYSRRYPDRADKFSLIENGYDEGAFLAAGNTPVGSSRLSHVPFTLVHSGIIYPNERDPTCLFGALARLLKIGAISSHTLRIVLRATGHDAYIQRMIDHAGIQSVVTLAPPVPYAEALNEMLNADGLLILQAANCNDQIPAKLYEYLRAGRPILGLTDPEGDTGKTLLAAGINTIAPLDSEEAIERALMTFVGLLKAGAAPIASDDVIAAASRRGRTAEFARLLNAIATK